MKTALYLLFLMASIAVLSYPLTHEEKFYRVESVDGVKIIRTRAVFAIGETIQVCGGHACEVGANAVVREEIYFGQ